MDKKRFLKEYYTYKLFAINSFIAREKIILFSLKLFLFLVFAFLLSLLLKNSFLVTEYPLVSFFLKVTFSYYLATIIVEKIKKYVTKPYEEFVSN